MFNFKLKKRIALLTRAFFNHQPLPENINEYMYGNDPVAATVAAAICTNILSSPGCRELWWNKSQKIKMLACDIATFYAFKSVKKNLRPELTEEQVLDVFTIVENIASCG